MRAAFAWIAIGALVWGGCASGEDETSADAGPTSSTSAPRDSITPLAPPTSRAGDTTSTTTTTLPAAPCPSPAKSEDPTVEIAVSEFRFDPACVAMTAEQGINVTNTGSAVHNVTLVIVGEEEVEFLGSDLQPGQNTATEAFGHQGPGANTYRLFCRYHQDQGMEAYLMVSAA